ncbi:hypothetical protein MTR67_007809 [Solanum verrucosum]|uniref:Uncharacterized protein n=1 Tax=Solanum verrucosum TaxID=315347 RepID=A0AAF0TDE3_SOLVR|nr:hypothetical protein MTR67_007809 [Solanum verrucosum]
MHARAQTSLETVVLEVAGGNKDITTMGVKSVQEERSVCQTGGKNIYAIGRGESRQGQLLTSDTGNWEAPYGVSRWRSIRAHWTFLKDNSLIKVNDGNKTLFWRGNWLGNGSHQERFLDIVNLVVRQRKTMAEIRREYGWFRRMQNYWEIQRVTEFYNTLESFSGLQEGTDLLRLKGHSSGKKRYNSMLKVFSLCRESRDCESSILTPQNYSLALETFH